MRELSSRGRCGRTRFTARRAAVLLAIAAAAVAALMPAAARADAPDTTPPVIQSVSVSPTAVDVNSGAQSVTVSATITDDSAGVYYAYIAFSSPSGSSSPSTYLYRSAPGSDVFTGTITVQRWVQPGDWHVSYLLAYDNVYNNVSYSSAAAVAAAGLDAPIAVTSTEDALPPQFQSLSLSPTSVDITNSSQTVNVSATITDDASGVQWAQLAYSSPTGAHTAYAYLSRSAPGSDVWTGTMTLPQWVETGNWHPSYLYAGDGVGHTTYLYGSAIATAGLDTVLSVTGTADNDPPEFHSVSVTPSAVDDGAKARTVNVSATITDDVSGVSSAQVGFSSPSGYTAWAYLSRSAPGSDVWTGMATIQQFAEAGTWHVYYLQTSDVAGHSGGFFSAAQVAAAGLDAPITVTTTPELPVHHFKVRAAPSSVAAGDSVTITITAQDSINQTVPQYAGPVTLTDGSGTLVVNSITWASGVGTADVSVPGPFHGDTVNVADGTGLTAAPTGTSNTFNVVGPATHLTVRVSSSTPAAGAPVTVAVTALDSLNQPVPGFTGPVTLSDLSGSMTITSPLAWSNGVGTATVSVANPYHADRVNATAAGLPAAASPTFNVVGAIDRFLVRITPTSVASGGAVTVTVTAQDALGQTVTGYSGAVTLTDLSGSLSVTTPIAWNAGVGTAAGTVNGPYKADKVTASDAAGVTGASNAFNVIGALDHFLVRVSPLSASTGGPVTVTITAQDALNQTVAGYAGPVTLTDLSGSLSAGAVSWAATGIGTATVSVSSAYHADRVTATDPSGPTGSSNTFNVTGAATHLVVKVSPTSVLVRDAVTVTVTALDALNQTAVGFTGSGLSFSDLSGNLLVASYATWSGGIGTATVKVTVPYHADRVSIYDWWYGFSATSNTFNVI